MTIGQKNLNIDGMTWHCLSIFYAKNNIAVLLTAIYDFFETNKNLTTHWSFYFSQIDGEHVDLVIISKEHGSDTLVELAEKYFERFLNEDPSENLFTWRYGSDVWAPYPNNSLVWNAFDIPSFLRGDHKMRDFSQLTSSLIVNLYDSESSYDENVVTISTFLHIKFLKKQNVPLPKFDEREIAEAIHSYWDYEEDGLLAEWIQRADVENTFNIIRCHLNFWEKGLVLT